MDETDRYHYSLEEGREIARRLAASIKEGVSSGAITIDLAERELREKGEPTHIVTIRNCDTGEVTEVLATQTGKHTIEVTLPENYQTVQLGIKEIKRL